MKQQQQKKLFLNVEAKEIFEKWHGGVRVSVTYKETGKVECFKVNTYNQDGNSCYIS